MINSYDVIDVWNECLFCLLTFSLSESQTKRLRIWNETQNTNQLNFNSNKLYEYWINFQSFHSMDSKSNKNGSAAKKRPEIALYKPGMGKILAKKGDNEAVGK